VLSVRRLVEVVWGEAPPATAYQQVLTCASALRQQLGAVIETTESSSARLTEGTRSRGWALAARMTAV
jgi:hypothetical protein